MPPPRTVRARSEVMISAISEALRPLNRGTRASMLQVMTNSRRWISWAKAVAMMPTGSASMTRPITAVSEATSLPAALTG